MPRRSATPLVVQPSALPSAPLLALILVLAGCAQAPQSSTAPTAPAAPTAATAAAPAATPPTAGPASARRVCDDTPLTGSRLGTMRCRTVDDATQAQDEAARALEEARQIKAMPQRR